MTTIEKAIDGLTRCNGACKTCRHWHIKTASLTDQQTVYAHYCDFAYSIGFIWYGEKLSVLKQETLKMLRFELEFEKSISK